MESVEFDGSYDDGATPGPELITWRIAESSQPMPPYSGPGFEIHTSIRGVDLSGTEFDSLDPDSEDDAQNAGLAIGPMGLSECILSGRIPCLALSGGVDVPTTVDFVLDLRTEALSNFPAPQNLRLSLAADITNTEIVDDWFEDGLLRLEKALPQDVHLQCCVTCLYSDYSPGGHGLIGMFCHRDAKDQYLQVSSKADYWSVPVTEEVTETYLCDQYVRRVPGTGYRG